MLKTWATYLLLAMVSRKIVNLFENFVWVLEKYFEHVYLLIFEFFEISVWVV